MPERGLMRIRSWSCGSDEAMLPTSVSTGSLKAMGARQRRRQRSRWLRADILAILVLLTVIVVAAGWFYSSIGAASHPLPGGDAHSMRRTSRLTRSGKRDSLRTLVIYVYSGTDDEYEENLRYFLREGVKADDGVTYIIAMQHGSGLHDLNPEPKLPRNARFVNHPNECFDIGTIGWVLENHVTDVRAFKYLVWINSSVRGPFLPAYMPAGMHWTEALTSKINEDTKLVGCTINCGGAYTISQPQPHVQSYVVATDLVGLDIIKRRGTVLQCHADMAEMVTLSEIGMSTAILEAGYNLDSLMLRYQGVDWRDKRAAACNGNRNPIQESFYDGVNPDPLELMFIKVKASMRDAHWEHVLQALKYDDWTKSRLLGTADRFEALAKNGWLDIEPQRIADAQRRGQKCFDRVFYVTANRFDLGFINAQPDPEAAAWQHFINAGIHEGRPHRFSC